jgi:hypothetical protein
MPVMDDVSVNWSVLPTATLSHFVLWRSTNGKDFVPVSDIQAQASVYNYHYMDRVNATNSFYKLEQVSKDGSSSFSSVLFVNFGKLNDGFRVQSVNRNSITVQVQSGRAEQGSLSIFNMDGRLIGRQNITVSAGTSLYSLSVPLAAGVYIASFQPVSKAVKSVQFIVQ